MGASSGAIWAILWPTYIYKALPLYSGFGFTFSKAAGGKMIARENPPQHGMPSATVVLRAEDTACLGTERGRTGSYLRTAVIDPFHTSKNQLFIGR